MAEKKTAKANTAKSAAKAAKTGVKALAKLSTTQVFLIALAGTLVAVGALWSVILTREGDIAQKRAEAMLKSFEPSHLSPLELTNVNNSLGSLPDLNGLEPYVAPDAPQYESERDIERAIKNLSNYRAIAKIYIKKLDLTLPILSESSPQALKISVCRFDGPEPLQPGNLVVTGHNYKSGAHFGRLNELAIGDEVIITDDKSNSRRYFVYEILTVEPDDMPALDPGKNKNVVTLVTCADNGTKRLLVKCRSI